MGFEHWIIKKLEDTEIQLIDGDRGKNYPSKKDLLTIGHTLFLSNKNLHGDKLTTDLGEYISEERDNLLRNGKLFRNDILMSTRGSVGNIGFFHKEIPVDNIRINSGMIILRNKDETINTEFLYQLLKSPYCKNQYLELTSGSVQNQLPIRDLKKLELMIPTLAEQSNIVFILKALDYKIENNDSIIVNLEQLAQTLFKRWFVDLEFPNENDEPYKSSGGEMVESELGMIPDDWSNGTLSDIGEIVGGSTPSKKIDEYYSEDGYSWITPKDLSNDKSTYIYKGAIDITELAIQKSRVKLHPERTVLFSSRAPIGYVAIAGQDIATNQGFKSIIPKENISSEYVYLLLKYITPVIEANAGGSTFKEISGAGMKGIKIIIPSRKVLKKYGDLIKPLFNRIKDVEKENRLLIELRDVLLPKLLSGEIEIPDEAEVMDDVPF